jgi:hypothetical protein
LKPYIRILTRFKIISSGDAAPFVSFAQFRVPAIQSAGNADRAAALG